MLVDTKGNTDSVGKISTRRGLPINKGKFFWLGFRNKLKPMAKGEITVHELRRGTTIDHNRRGNTSIDLTTKYNRRLSSEVARNGPSRQLMTKSSRNPRTRNRRRNPTSRKPRNRRSRIRRQDRKPINRNKGKS